MMNGRIIVALDLPTADAALDIAKRVDAHVAGFKIGLACCTTGDPNSSTSSWVLAGRFLSTPNSTTSRRRPNAQQNGLAPGEPAG